MERFMVVGAVILRKEWELLVDPDASWIRGIRTRDRAPVSLPERPVEQSFPDHLLLSSNVRELQRAARRMVAEENWYTALELYMEVLRRHERSEDQEVDVTLYNRIGDLHRRLAVEWYVEAADHYTERSLRHGAIALCEKALQLDPGQAEVRHNLTWLLDRTARPPAPVDGSRPEPSAPASPWPEPPPPEPEEHARPPEPEPEMPAPAPEPGVSAAPEPAVSATAEAGANATAEAEVRPTHADGVGEVFEVEPLPGRPRRASRPTRPGGEPATAARPEPATAVRPERDPDAEPEVSPEPAPVADDQPSGTRPEEDSEPLPDRIVLPPPDEEYEYEELRRRVRRIVVGAGATLAALIVVALIAL